ncbi:MAG: Ldh family oxidoreductase, partial [Pseudomonadota bacterium]
AGDAKGSALALIVEVLAGALAGPSLSAEASSFFEAEGAPPAVGQTLIAIDPAAGDAGMGDAGVGDAGVGARIERLCTAIAAEEGARLPGARRLQARAAAAAEGVSVPDPILAEIRAIAGG